MVKAKLLFCCFFSSCIHLIAQEKESYLSINSMILSDSSLNNNGLKQMDDDIINNKVFLIGEDHLGIKNGEIETLIYKKLLNSQKTIHIFFEAPLSLEHSLKKYIYEGDTIEYQTIYNAHPFAPEEEMQFLREVRMQVKKGLLVKISAIDIEVNCHLTIKRLIELLPNDTVPLDLEEIINKISNTTFSITSHKISKDEYIKFYELADELEISISKNSDLLKNYLKENYTEFALIAHQYLLGVKYAYTKKTKGREFQLYLNCIKVIKENPNDIFLGAFGVSHTSLRPIPYNFFTRKKTVAYMLNKSNNSPVKGSVCSIAINYERNTNEFYLFFKNQKDHLLFLNYSTTPLTLFKLDGRNTPFKKMAEKFQYIVINKY